MPLGLGSIAFGATALAFRYQWWLMGAGVASVLASHYLVWRSGKRAAPGTRRLLWIATIIMAGSVAFQIYARRPF